MPKFKYRIISSLLIFIIIFPVLTTLVIPISCSATSNDKQTDESKSSFLKGILLILLSIFINKYQSQKEETPDDKIGEQPLIEESHEITGFYVNWLTQNASSYQSLQENGNSMDIVSPFWYTANPDGSIESRYGGHQYEVASLAQKHNLKLIPLINNNQQNNMILIEPKTRKKTITNIINLVNKHNYAGVNIDFEFLPSWTRNSYTNFIKELSQKLKQYNKMLVISVFPKIDVPINLQGAYDYSALIPHVDRIVMMTYDHHWSTGPSGPVAPINWVEKNIKYALEYIPQHKLLLGIANYGYDWGQNQIGEDMGTKKVLKVATKRDAEILWHDEYKVPHFNYHDINGLEHEVWFENSYSLEHKLDLVNKYNLKGIAIWRLGNARKRFWDIIDKKL